MRQIYLGAAFEGPESTSFEDDPVPLTKNEDHHADDHHQQEQRCEDSHDPQVARRHLHHSCTQIRSHAIVSI